MKSDKLTKLLVILVLALFAAALLLFAATAWGIVSLSGFVNYLEDGSAFVRVLIGILFVLLFAGVVYTIIKAAKIGKALPAKEMNLLSQSNSGSSYISSEAVSKMVQRLLKRNDQVRNAACTVNPVEDGVTIDIKTVVYSGGDLNQLCAQIQNGIKYEIESATGIPVRNVAVNIVKTIEGAKETVPETKRVN